MSGVDPQGGLFAALGSRGYRLFWLGSVASVGGVQLVIMGQSWLVFELRGRAVDLAILGLAASAPTIVVTLIGGVVADQFDRRRILQLTTLLSVLLLGALTVLDATDTATVWHVWIIAALFAAVAGFDWPARQAIYTALIERSQMASAITLNSVLWQGTRMIMPALGGVLVAAFTTAAVFAAATAGFVAMGLVLTRLTVRARTPERGNSLDRFAEGLAFVRETPMFRVLIPLTYVTMFFGTSYLQIMPLFADRLGVGAEGFGLLLSASGVGSIAGTVATGMLQRAGHIGWLMLGGASGAGLAQIAFAALTAWHAEATWAFWTALVLVALVAALSSVFLILSLTLLQLNVPERLRGRVMSLHGITFSLISLGALFSGGLASVTGAPAAVAVGAAIIVVWVAGVTLRFPFMRQLDDMGDATRGR